MPAVNGLVIYVTVMPSATARIAARKGPVNAFIFKLYLSSKKPIIIIIRPPKIMAKI